MNLYKMMKGTPFSTMGEEEKARIVGWVRRFGGLATDALLDPSMHAFQEEAIDGFIGYRVAGKAFIVFGDPVCTPEEQLRLAKAFYHFAAPEGKEVVYVAASDLFAHTVVRHIGGSLVEVAKEIIFDPACDPREQSGTLGSLVRRKVKQAEDAGIRVQEYLERNEQLDRALEEVATLWLKHRRGPQIHISNIYLFENCLGKRWFYAQEGDTVVGVVVLHELKEHKGYLINHLMLLPQASHGTSEYLIISVLETLAKEDCRFATVGIVPNGEVGEIIGLHRFCAWCVRKGLQCAKKIVSIEGLYTFWKKFHPQLQPSYLIFSRNRVGLLELMGLKKVLTVDDRAAKKGQYFRKVFG